MLSDDQKEILIEAAGKRAAVAFETKLTAMREFLQNTPPGQTVQLAIGTVKTSTGKLNAKVHLPDLHLHCTHPACGGTRIFECAAQSFELDSVNGSDERFLSYLCRNCRTTYKTFALRTHIKDETLLQFFKFGEDPSFGPPTPEKVLKLFGSEREYFFKGRRAESQGLGIAAFAYYRRVIEAKRNALFDEVIRVSETLHAPADMIADLKQAKTETQFTKAIEAIKHGIPNVLFINGVNPLTLLHDVLSDGLHGRTDEECLQDATNIRIVLTEFVEKLSQALKDDAELSNAVSAMVNRKAKRAQGAQ
jgi:hypothetical protein